jgi:alanine racemase
MESRELSRCWAEIDLNALRHNVRVARECVGASVELMAVVKANAYGHGLPQIAKALAPDADLFGVATLEEALDVRANAPDRPVLILGPSLPEEHNALVRHGFIASVSSYEEAAGFNSISGQRPAQLNLVIDTGMGRMGVQESDALGLAKRIAQLPRVMLHSISTHLPVADEDAAFTRDELSRFGEIVARLRDEVPGGYKVHALLSAGILGFSEKPFDIVRAGLLLYGASPLPQWQQLLKPLLTLKARVALIRDLPENATISYGRTFTTPHRMRVATISAGYADGYPRALSNRGASVLIRGRRCAVLGRVTMDMIMADVSHVNAIVGDEVVLIGKQGDEEVSAREVAERAGTIAWDIFTGIGTRVRRVYL